MLAASRDYRRDIQFEDELIRARAIENSDIAELIRLGEETGLSQWTANCYLEELKNIASIMLRLIDDENRLIGFVVGRLVPSTITDRANDAEIYNIAIRTRSQRKGRGDVIFNAFLDVCYAVKVSQVWLEVRESNEKAIGFYLNKGFAVVQKRPGFYSDPPENALVMRLTLENLKLDK
jgi:[ribosomal protein S18]-alanine N-acetyltransferase